MSGWGGARPGSGRKVGSVKDPALKKTKHINIPCTEQEKAAIENKARECGKSVAAFILERVLKGGCQA